MCPLACTGLLLSFISAIDFAVSKAKLQKRRMGNPGRLTVFYFQLVEDREQLDNKRYLVYQVGSCRSVGSWKSSRLTGI